MSRMVMCDHGSPITSRRDPESPPHRPSNGPTEGQGFCVKKVKAAGQGSQCFENYQLRVVLHAGGVIWPRRPRPAAQHQTPLSQTRRPDNVGWDAGGVWARSFRKAPMMRLAEARIYTGELALLYQLLAESPDVETGGELLGLWSHQGSPTIMLVTGPDSNATRTETHFLQPPDIHMMIERHMWDSFGLQVLGIWHSHHRLGLHELSKGDRLRTQRYASNHGRLRYIELLGYLDDSRPGKPEIRPYLYSEAPQLKELPVNVLELPGRSPIRDALTRHPPPTVLHTSLLLGAPSVKWAGGFGTEVAVDRDSYGPEETDIDSAGGADLPDEAQSNLDVELVSDCHLDRQAEDEALAADPLAQHRDDAVVDVVLALEKALARLPESATKLVGLSIDESEMQLSIDARGHRAKLFVRMASPREIEYRPKATAYPVLYTAGSHELLADFYYERLGDALDDAAPGLRAPHGQARAT